ncbi:MAG: apolipoprotein N-acyltransferase [Pseudomonadota bacterium]
MPFLARWLPGPGQALAALGGGLVLAAAFPNLDLWPLCLVGLVPLLWLAGRLEPRQALVAGWLFGLSLGLALRYWLTVVMTTYGGVPWALSILGLVLLELYLSLYVAVFAGLVAYLASGGFSPIYCAPLVWAGLEWVRGWALTGFPWLPLSAGLSSFPVLLQSAEWWGATGVSALLVLVNALLARALLPPAGRPRLERRRLAAGLAAVILLVSAWLGGAWRMERVERAAEAAPQLLVSVVQANIPLEEMWRPAWRSSVIQRHLLLTAQASLTARERPWLVVWPESAAPFYFLTDARDSQPVLEAARGLGAYITLGSQGLIQAGPPLVASNRVWLVGPRGLPEGYYDKVHLVPFGEYVPAPGVFFFVRAIAAMGIDFRPGGRGDTLKAGDALLGPLICYESIFPELAQAQRQQGAALMVNQTNDSWYGRTGAAYQHMSHLVLRAIENRVAAARAANTGVSCFVLPDGRIVQATGLFVPAVETRRLPLLAMPTLFTRLGDVVGPLGLAFGLAAWLWVLIANKRRPQSGGQG